MSLERARLKPYAHQVVAVEMLTRLHWVLNADDMGLGKTKESIDAAQVLFERGEINRVLVFAPAAVRSVWFGPRGELRKHLWVGLPSVVNEFHTKLARWMHPGDGPPLEWWVTNYEFIRSKNRLTQLLGLCGPKTLLILDESSAVKNHAAQQTKACLQIRRKCGRVWLLNGTPIAHSPKDLFSQGNILHPSILECPYITHFLARYAKLQPLTLKDGRRIDTIVGWTNLEDLQQRFAPYVLRRLKSECMDLPAKLPSVEIEVPLTSPTWKHYKEMRDKMVIWLQNTVWTAPQVIVQILRLSQITSGFIGGQRDVLEADESEELPDWIDKSELPFELLPALAYAGRKEITDIGSEKLDAFLAWLQLRLELDQNLKLLVWCRFRPEVERLARAVSARFEPVTIGKIWGDQKPAERESAKALLEPDMTPDGPVVVFGTVQTGGVGLTLVGADHVFYYSNDRSLKTRKQSEDRVHRPGQTRPVNYFDLIATGPKGERTIDHIILDSLRTQDNLATWTTSKWIRALTDAA